MGMNRDDWQRPSRAVTRTARWKAIRVQALRRDGFKCRECGVRGRMEVHHVQPVRTHPDRAYDLTNLLTLCGSCHARQTAIELGHGQDNTARAAWRSLLRIPLNSPQNLRNEHA